MRVLKYTGIIGIVVIFALLALSSLFGRALAQTPQCVTLEQADSIIAERGWQRVLVTGDAVRQWVTLAEDHNIDLSGDDFDFVVVVLDEAGRRAFVLYGKNGQLCDTIVMPLDMAEAMLDPFADAARLLRTMTARGGFGHLSR